MLTELENPDLLSRSFQYVILSQCDPSSLINTCKLISPIYVDYVAYTGPIPSLDYFPFKTRALALVKKWRRPKAAATSAALSDIFFSE